MNIAPEPVKPILRVKTKIISPQPTTKQTTKHAKTAKRDKSKKLQQAASHWQFPTFFLRGKHDISQKRESLPGYSLLDIGYSISTQHRISTKILLEANNPRLATKHGYPTSES